MSNKLFTCLVACCDVLCDNVRLNGDGKRRLTKCFRKKKSNEIAVCKKNSMQFAKVNVKIVS